MALTGLQIQKLLPQTNCKECGSNTCLAFAMKLASKKADISQCPYASDEAKKTLGEAYEPPVKTVAFGIDKKLLLGGETVLYRHEKTFVNKTVFAVNINDTDVKEAIDKTLNEIKNYTYERVGETFTVDMISVTQKGNDKQKFIDLTSKVWQELKKPLILRSNEVNSLIEAAKLIHGSHSVISVMNSDMIDQLLPVARECELALAITEKDLDSLLEISNKIKESEFFNILLQIRTESLAEQFQMNTIARRAAIKENNKLLGYPYLRYIDNGNMLEDAVDAATEVLKYGGICVLPYFDPAFFATLMTLRLNIFTDPQNPIQVEPKLYSIGDPKPDSPIFVTTNFSLTFFVVSGEIENSGISAWLLIPECEGMSVLTAWAAGKFSASSIAKFIKEINLEEQIKTREIIIPGYVAQISGELEENLPGWKVLIGPQEASDLESFIKVKLAG